MDDFGGNTVSDYVVISESPEIVQVFSNLTVNNVGIGTAADTAIAPPIPGLSAGNVWDALNQLAPKEFSQLTPSAEWLWNHNLGYRPTVKIYNLAYQEIDAVIFHFSENQLRVSVSPPMPGFIVI